MSLDDLKEQIGAKEPEAPVSLDELLHHPGVLDRFRTVAPVGFAVERMASAAMQLVRVTEGLHGCPPRSFIPPLMTVAQLGLELGPLSQAWLVPRNGRPMFQLGWTGILELVRRSGDFVDVQSGIIADWDELQWRQGSDRCFIVTPTMPRALDDRPVAYWCVVRFATGGFLENLIEYDDMVAIASDIPGATRTGSAWSTHFDTMARITCFRRMRNWLPLSPDLAQAFRAEEDSEEGDGVVPVPTSTPATPARDGGDATHDVADAPSSETPDTEAVSSSTASDEPSPEAHEGPSTGPAAPAADGPGSGEQGAGEVDAGTGRSAVDPPVPDNRLHTIKDYMAEMGIPIKGARSKHDHYRQIAFEVSASGNVDVTPEETAQWVYDWNKERTTDDPNE